MSNITSFKCSDGYDCTNFDELGQNESPTPVGKECPVGHYCQGGNIYPCPAGTYRETIKATSIEYCLSCKPGYYCEEGTGVFDDTILCVAGHYCPTGTDLVNMTSNICSPGHFCPQGADREIPCPAGSYCPDFEMIEPIICNNGSISNELCDEVGQTRPKVCPEGFICPAVSCTTDTNLINFDLENFHSYGCLYKCFDESCPQFAQPCGKGKYR